LCAPWRAAANAAQLLPGGAGSYYGSTDELLLNSCHCRLAVASSTDYTKVPQTAWNVPQTLRLILWLRLCLKKTPL